MACSRAFMLLCMVVVSMAALLLGGAKATITCSQVVNKLTPCISYLEKGGTPASGCCSGIKTLYSTAHTTADLQGVCNCLKEKISSIHYSSSNVRFAAGLPAKCGIKIPYKISPSTNCKSIK
ncbi:non-specific lipid-transfer protein 1-like [Rosa rugosa]|uniref:non-specific lipid-transfer protein 1-like n=1 Tax=Rosa rugosa TaxID=74645 RepID=UPI002B408B63|nr:non-specific lipid-transfer protein 1-like [Rosa rugosa]